MRRQSPVDRQWIDLLETERPEEAPARAQTAVARAYPTIEPTQIVNLSRLRPKKVSKRTERRLFFFVCGLLSVAFCAIVLRIVLRG
jgi:hypothetical protein